MPNPDQNKTVRLSTFDNEPLARLAEQRLRQSGIPCFVRSQGGGPGLWGSSYYLPQAVYVYQSDRASALGLLGLPESTEAQDHSSKTQSSRTLLLVAAIFLVLLAVSLLGVLSR